jgi:serine/threonine protein phosphatase PrpC
MRDELLHLLEGIVDRAGCAIYKAAQQRPELSGMCTTGVVLVFVEQGVFIAHAGDSRAYLLRGNQTYQLTEDHTLANRFLKDGLIGEADLPDFPFTNVLTRTFGSSPHIDIDTLFVQVEVGDRFILCSDGLHNYIQSYEFQSMGEGCGDSGEFLDRLIAEANLRGGEDNITVAVVETSSTGSSGQYAPSVDLDRQLEFMRSLFLFRNCNEQELLKVMRIIYTERRFEGDVIIQEGTEGQELYTLIEGSVEVTLEGEHLVTLSPGAHFGELALIDNTVRSASITARSDVTMLVLGREDFNRLLQEDHSLAVKLLSSFLQKVNGRVRELSVEVKNLSKELAAYDNLSTRH